MDQPIAQTVVPPADPDFGRPGNCAGAAPCTVRAQSAAMDPALTQQYVFAQRVSPALTAVMVPFVFSAYLGGLILPAGRDWRSPPGDAPGCIAAAVSIVITKR